MPRSLQQIVAELDLSEQAKQLVNPEGKYRWDAARAAKAVQGYRNFLILCKEDEQTHHQPSKDVDEVWHLHILDTQKYAADCSSIFGYFLHHIPDPVRFPEGPLTEGASRLSPAEMRATCGNSNCNSGGSGCKSRKAEVLTDLATCGQCSGGKSSKPLGMEGYAPMSTPSFK